MSSLPTDHANLDLTQFNLDVAFGRTGGRIIWQPRILCWWTDKKFKDQPLPEPYDQMTYVEMYRHLQCSNRIYEFNACFERVEDTRVKVTERQINQTDREITWETPVGTQRAVYRQSSNHPSPATVKWPICNADDARVATWRAEHASWKWNQQTYDHLLNQWSGLGAPTIYMPRVTVQDLYVDTMGVEAAVFALYDWPAEVEKYFAALDECHDRLIDVLNASPIKIINFGDNIHSGTLPPNLFEKYILPVYQHRCERLHSSGKFVHAHWDGNCKPLLPYAGETGLDGIEAITPVPQGDVTLEEIKTALGDQMFLLDGIPAIYFDHTFGQDVLTECTKKVIDLFAPRLILGISDEISSTGDIERVRLVGQIVDDYNAALVSEVE